MTDKENLDIVRAIHEVDACEFCHGAKGGVLGNENVVTINGEKKLACDYCTSEMSREKPRKYEMVEPLDSPHPMVPDEDDDD